VDTSVLLEVEKLRRASLAELRAKYGEVFQEEPRSRNREHLFRRIAWRLQALAEGDLCERARRRAQEIAHDADLRMIAPPEFLLLGGEPIKTVSSGRKQGRPDRRLPLPGTLLQRYWRGRNIVVEVLASGFRYQGRHYSSLSAIAVEITGTRWNGLAFFGLLRPGQKVEGAPGEQP
jgi:Protein of unknown function (DUF2924)